MRKQTHDFHGRRLQLPSLGTATFPMCPQGSSAVRRGDGRALVPSSCKATALSDEGTSLRVPFHPNYLIKAQHSITGTVAGASAFAVWGNTTKMEITEQD